MIQSIKDDMKSMLKHGSMVTKLILVNIIAFVIFGVIIKSFFPSFYDVLIDYLALSSDLWWNIRHPWVFITHMFLHAGLYHIFWNLLLFYWFGNILGDLIGDSKILPLFIYGGLSGAVFFILSSYINLPELMVSGRALGASAAVMATILAAGILAPDFKVRLILIGTVSIKYIVIALVIMDLIGTTGNSNTGGHIAHLGGAAFGWLFISNLKSGTDFSIGFNRIWKRIADFFSNKPKSPLKVKHRSSKQNIKRNSQSNIEKDMQKRVDEILDKINEKGYDQLTEEEKEFLFLASKKQK